MTLISIIYPYFIPNFSLDEIKSLSIQNFFLWTKVSLYIGKFTCEFNLLWYPFFIWCRKLNLVDQPSDINDMILKFKLIQCDDCGHRSCVISTN